MKSVLMIVGVLAMLAGLLFVGQGAGVIDWPQSSFMIDQRPWIWRGAIIAAIGLVIVLIALRRPR